MAKIAHDAKRISMGPHRNVFNPLENRREFMCHVVAVIVAI